MWRRILKGTKTSDRWEAQSELRDEINRIQDLVEAERRAQGLMAGAAAAWNGFYPSVLGKYFIASDYYARARKGSAVLRAIVVRPDEDTEEDSFGIATIPPSDSSDCRYDYIAEHARSLPSSATSGRGGHAQGFIKDKPKGPNFSTASKPPINKTKPKDKIPSGKYRVETGDTLSGIAKKAGVTLAELRSANPQIKDPRKIFRNTGVTIPKGKTAAGGYTGPVPYRPGSKAAADYEASRKKK